MPRASLTTPAFWRAALALAAASQLSGCYVLQAARGQLALNARRVPIATLLASPSTPPALHAQLALASELRRYASQRLGLPENGSYRSYVDLGRRYVVWNVYAAAELSVEPRRWCFPVAGCVAYRGYFSEQRARDFGLTLESRGFDVLVSGVPAYSTLGHFADPVLSSMLGWDDSELAALMFHELAHQLLYVPGDTAFNEAFATVVEEEGVRRWLAAGGRDTALAEYRLHAARAAEVAALVAAARGRLQALYAGTRPPAETRRLKAAEFERLRGDYLRLRARWGGAGDYEWLFGAGLNNARLLVVATYYDCVPRLAAELAAVGGQLGDFYAAMRRLAQPAARARRQALCAAPAA